MPRMRYDWQSPPSQSLRTHVGTGCAQQARVDAKRQTQASASNHKRAMSEKRDQEKRCGELMRRMRQ